jgi:hypothetical protein
MVADEPRRGETRSGLRYTGERKSHYSSLRELRRAHPRTFAREATQYLLGKTDDDGPDLSASL